MNGESIIISRMGAILNANSGASNCSNFPLRWIGTYIKVGKTRWLVKFSKRQLYYGISMGIRIRQEINNGPSLPTLSPESMGDEGNQASFPTLDAHT